ncbi:damage-control phosphatase ARMT1 [Drosophila willistoni]|nr:damage-control phosphatase ARMT1 [Drosophila willistoni]
MNFENHEDFDTDLRNQTSLFSDITGYTENNSADLDAIHALRERKFCEKNSIIDRVTPFREELSAKYKRSLAYVHFTERVPNILMDVICFLQEDEPRLIQEYGEYVHFDLKRIIWSLTILHQDISENRLLTVFHGKAPDTQSWNKFLLGLYEEKNQWLSAVWLHAECYMYRRIWAIFNRSYTLKNYDYFSQQKISGAILYKDLMLNARNSTKGLERSEENLQFMLQLSLWGNQNWDLSREEDILTLIDEQEHNLLVDESAICWRLLTETTLKPIYLDIVCNNAGFELFADFLLAEYIIETGLAQRVRFHVKPIPWFIKDATQLDITWLLRYLCTHEFPQLAAFGRRLRGFVRDRSIIICKDTNFWTSPREFSAMKKLCPCLYLTLSEASLVIFKGDHNYRKLLGDINWDWVTPFKDCLKGFLPTSLCALRPIKTDIYCGLPTCMVEWQTDDNPKWMTTGEKAVIQVAIKSRP